MVLTAIVADKDVGVWISDRDKDHAFSTLPQYSKISYIAFTSKNSDEDKGAGL